MGGAVKLVVDVKSDLRSTISAVVSKVIETYADNLVGDISVLQESIESASGQYKLTENLELLVTALDYSDCFRIRISNSYGYQAGQTSYNISILDHDYSSGEVRIVFELEGARSRYSRQRIWQRFPDFVCKIDSIIPFFDSSTPIPLSKLKSTDYDFTQIIKEIVNPKRRRVILVFLPSNSTYTFSFRQLVDALDVSVDFLFSAHSISSSDLDLEENRLPSGLRIQADTLYFFEPGRSVESLAIPIPFIDLDSSEDLAEKKRFNSRIRNLSDRIISTTSTLSLPLSVSRKLRMLNHAEKDVIVKGKTVNFLINENQTELFGFQDVHKKDLFLLDQTALSKFLSRIGKRHLGEEDLDDIADSLDRISLLSAEVKRQADELESLELQIMYLREDLEEETLGRLEEFEQKSKLKAEIRYLRDSLVNTQAAYLAFQPVPDGEFEGIPLSFYEVVQRITNLPFVEYTGSPDHPEDLDQIDTGSSAPRCWEYLEALDDYARAKRNKVFDGNLMTYLKNTPNEFRNFSFHKYAPKESEKTLNQPNLVKVRTFPVPVDVNIQGQVLMESHIKVSRRIRMHFFDDTNNTGLIYLGYIGQHLPLADD